MASTAGDNGEMTLADTEGLEAGGDGREALLRERERVAATRDEHRVLELVCDRRFVPAFDA
eukprot:3026652-Rhodomonas_salina.1